MTKKGMSLLLVLALVLSLLPISAMANTANITITTEGFPEDWVGENQTVTITANNSLNQVQSMTVNGTPVSAADGSAFYLLKQLEFNESTNTLTMGVFLGNQIANGGQFAFTYDTTKLQPATEVVNDFYVGASDITLIKKAPTETRAGSGYLDTAKGNGYVTWVVSSGATVGNANSEKQLLTMSFILKNGVSLSDLNATTFGTPAVSELYKPSMNESACLTINGTATITNLKKAFLLNNNIYGDKIYNDFVFQGETNGNAPFEVVVTDKNNNTKTETFPVKVDLTKTLDAPTFTVSEDHTVITVSDVACATNAPSGVTFTAELYVSGQKIDEKSIQNGEATFTAPEGVTATVKVIAKSGVGVTSVVQKDIFVPVIDRIGPEITVSGLPETEWTNQNVVFTVSASDPSGVKEIKVDGEVYTSAVTVTESKTITITAEDNEGNTSEKQITVKIDKQNPELSASVQDTWGKTNQISISATDAQSGVKEILVNGETLSGDSYTATQNGIVTVQVTDNAGNTYTTSLMVEKVDTDLPNVSVQISEDWAQTNTISVSATDSLSGVNEILIDGVVRDTLTASENGTHTVKVTDNAGNIYETVVTVSKVDITAPEVNVSKTEGWSQQATVSVSATDSQSGVKEILIDGIAQNSITVSENGDVAVVVTDNAGNIYEETVTVSNIDTVAPEIFVDEMPTESVKEFYITFSVSDDLSDIATVKVNGAMVSDDNGVYSYFVNQLGDYTIEVTDNAGNSASETVTVDFLDLVAPFVSVSASTTEWTNEDVTLTITAEQSDIYVNDELIAENATSATKEVSENGTFEIKAVDAAGNEGFASYTVDNIDKTLPQAQISVQDTWGKTNVISVSATDALSGVNEIKINGEVANSLTVSENGDVSVEVTDNAGNVFAQTVSVTKVDNENPTLQVSETTTTPCKQFVFEISADDGQSGIDKVYVNGNVLDGDTFTATQNGTYTFKAVDNVGNETVVTRELASIDDVAPQVTDVSGNPENWAKGTADITLAFSETVASVSVDGTEMGENVTSATFTADQNKTYNIVFGDLAGNEASYIVSVTYLDNTAPEISASAQDTWGKTNLISVSATDSQSGVKEIKINGEVTNSLSVSENGEYSVSVTDNVGNTATQTVVVSKVDTTAPTASVSVSDVWGQTNTVTVEAEDSQSGVASVTINSETINAQNGAYVYTATQNGEVTIVVTDIAGNVYETSATISKVDTDVPELSVSDAPEAWCKTYTFNVSATDSLSGVKEIAVNNEVLSGNEFVVTENGEYVFKATDNAGNVTTVTRTVDKIDTTAPVFNGEITVVSVNETAFTLQMPDATDPSDVTYAVKVNGEEKAYDGSGTFALSGLTMGQDYAVELTATDGAGNFTTITKTVKTAGLGGAKVVLDLKEISTQAQSLNLKATVNGTTKDLDANGTALFDGLTAGTYTVKIEGAGYVALEKQITVENGKTTELKVAISKTELRPGDINGDGKIELKDFNIIGSYYGDTCTTEIQKACDLNRDGKIDAKDVTLFLKGFVK